MPLEQSPQPQQGETPQTLPATSSAAVPGRERGRWPRPAQALAALVVLTLLASGVYAAGRLVAALQPSTSGAATPTVTLVPTATATPSPPRVLFQADWSHGAGPWALGVHWRLSAHGQLLNDGGGEESLTVPYLPATSDYAIEFRARILGIREARACKQFGLLALDGQGKTLYGAVAKCLAARLPYIGAAYTITQVESSASDFVPGSLVRTYRVEVEGERIVFCVSGACLGDVSSPSPPMPAR